jgi:hypothetical protein
VTGGSNDDGKQLPNLLKQSLEAGLKVKEILADTACSGN